MTITYPPSWNGLEYPHQRCELLLYLEELSSSDPRALWKEQQDRGLYADIDRVFHFFFDDHEFDERYIGYALFDEGEARAIKAIKDALDLILADHPRGTDDDFVRHPGWRHVREAAAWALAAMKDR